MVKRLNSEDHILTEKYFQHRHHRQKGEHQSSNKVDLFAAAARAREQKSRVWWCQPMSGSSSHDPSLTRANDHDVRGGASRVELHYGHK